MGLCPPILAVNGITIRFGGVIALSDVSLDVRLGEIHALIGPNGSGKTTLVNVITGIYKPAAGAVMLQGADITRSAVHERVGLGISRTFQNLRFAREMTVLDNVLAGMHCVLPPGFWRHALHTRAVVCAEEQAEARARDLLVRVGLKGGEKVPAGALSHAEAKRLELARALACCPKVLLLDEPTAGLGDAERDELMKIVQGLVAEGNLGVLLIEHSMRTVMAVSHRVSVLDHGTKIAEGLPGDIQKNEKVIEAYLGGKVDSCVSGE